MCVVSAVAWVVVGVFAIIYAVEGNGGFLTFSFWIAIGSGVLIVGVYPWVAVQRIWAGLPFLVLGGAGTLLAIKWQHQWQLNLWRKEELAFQRKWEKIKREQKRKKREQRRLNRVLSLVDNLTEVNLNREAELKHESLPILFEAIGRCTSIQKLRLQCRNLNDQDLLQLSEGLRSNTSLRVLDLRDNHTITQLGFTYLVSALKHSDHPLTNLFLDERVDTSPLIEIFRTNYTLTSVVHEFAKYRRGSGLEEEPPALTPHLKRNRDRNKFLRSGLPGDGHLPKLSLTLSTVALTDCQLSVIPPQLFDLWRLTILDLRYLSASYLSPNI